MKILIIEDEVNLLEALEYTLKKNNYSVDFAIDGITGEEMAETGLYNMIILDRMLPKKEGLEILKSIRRKGIKTPVLFLTAKDGVQDRISGLDSGADDYLVKPFSKEELLARIRAIARRQADVVNNEVYEINGNFFNPLKGEINIRGEITKLTSKESQIMEILLVNKNIILTKEQLLEKIWGFNSDIELNNIEVYISYLRKKLSAISFGIEIETIRGSGYCLKEVK